MDRSAERERGGIQEFNPILGVTAVGEGTVSGHELQLTYQSAMQTNGQAVLIFSPDGRNLTGNARDNVTGVSFPLMFNRLSPAEQDGVRAVSQKVAMVLRQFVEVIGLSEALLAIPRDVLRLIRP